MTRGETATDLRGFGGYEPGRVGWIQTVGGSQLAVWIRRNRNGRHVVRRIYFSHGADQPTEDFKLAPLRSKEQDLADAIAILLDERRG